MPGQPATVARPGAARQDSPGPAAAAGTLLGLGAPSLDLPGLGLGGPEERPDRPDEVRRAHGLRREGGAGGKVARLGGRLAGDDQDADMRPALRDEARELEAVE